MKNSLKIEELAQLGLGIFLFSQLSYAWWLFPVFLLVPDIGMIGYLVSPKLGAWTYNLLHHKAIGITFMVLGMLYLGDLYTFVGIIVFSHASMDRIFGYGLKYPDSFKNTHLGKI
ncbi:MAG: DUF4260 domain-containing protein [Altibacter sp.]|uniref:DUF4260 domain-containing protein n=1 Tax=Altibacter sp. TaxID=2024823 RepID=UPI001D82E1E1|nr:DUF4260 domain-containing protein [Altibacter sp.]MBZ0326097.1 DUF4260 domain-containing protein [Altibacter sp.]